MSSPKFPKSPPMKREDLNSQLQSRIVASLYSGRKRRQPHLSLINPVDVPFHHQDLQLLAVAAHLHEKGSGAVRSAFVPVLDLALLRLTPKHQSIKSRIRHQRRTKSLQTAAREGNGQSRRQTRSLTQGVSLFPEYFGSRIHFYLHARLEREENDRIAERKRLEAVRLKDRLITSSKRNDPSGGVRFKGRLLLLTLPHCSDHIP